MKRYKVCLFIVVTLFVTSCGGYDSSYSSNSSETGTAGSLARFAISGNYMYTVEFSTLKVFDISNEKEPRFLNQFSFFGSGIETIFTKDDYLFLGTRWGVEFISISNPENPVHISSYSHVYSCDPVVVSGNYAYSTLNSSGACGRGLDQLDVIDISDISEPRNITSIDMDDPKGLGVSGSLLFVCDNGIKVYNISNPTDPVFIQKVDVPAFDVIPLDGLLLVTSSTGLYEYTFDQSGNLDLLSTVFIRSVE